MQNQIEPPVRIKVLSKALYETCQTLAPFSIMEVCGTHTHNIARYGIKQLLPPQINLISGPGCPVCVTDDTILGQAILLCQNKDVIVMTFGDMLRVPVYTQAKMQDSLYRRMGLGDNVRIGTSPMDALKMAKQNPTKQVVWLSVGFETTCAHTAVMLMRAKKEHIHNVSILCAHKTMPHVLKTLLPQSNVQALLCPGHVAVITGAKAFSFLAEELHFPSIICGFTAEEILNAIFMIAKMRKENRCILQNAYPSVVTNEGNIQAQRIIEQVFAPCDAIWRGIGCIPKSGLTLQNEYTCFDARNRFSLPELKILQPEGCLCASVIQGKENPQTCPHFRKTCTPSKPIGPCMVSDEGTCHAAYLYGE